MVKIKNAQAGKSGSFSLLWTAPVSMATKLRTSSRLSSSILCTFSVAYCLTSYGSEVATDNSSAIGYRCTMGDIVRRVEINYPQSPETLPCEVIYHRDSEAPNNPEILWRAENDASYCEAQADAMVYRLTTEWGWQCDMQ